VAFRFSECSLLLFLALLATSEQDMLYGISTKISTALPLHIPLHQHSYTYKLMGFKSLDQWFPKCAPLIPCDPGPIPRGSVDTFL